MNTSSKGARYERAYKQYLYDHGAMLVLRAAASRGPFDLLSIEADAICGYQLKSGRLSCRAAQAQAETLAIVVGDWPSMLPYVVHKTKAEEFCRH